VVHRTLCTKERQEDHKDVNSREEKEDVSEEQLGSYQIDVHALKRMALE
jgi:hypothetical protein